MIPPGLGASGQSLQAEDEGRLDRAERAAPKDLVPGQERLRRHDQRHSFHHVDAVQRVWLQQLYDAGRPRLQLGQDFGVSRATVYRFVTDTADEPGTTGATVAAQPP